MEGIGTVTVSDRAVMQLAAHIASKCEGVIRLTDKSNRDGVSRALRGNGSTRGVYLIKSKSGLELEICVICRYGVNTAMVCDTITSNIKEELAQTGFNVKAVNVRITGVQK